MGRRIGGGCGSSHGLQKCGMDGIFPQPARFGEVHAPDDTEPGRSKSVLPSKDFEFWRDVIAGLLRASAVPTPIFG